MDVRYQEKPRSDVLWAELRSLTPSRHRGRSTVVPLPSARSLNRLAGMKRRIIAALLLLLPLSARAETPEEWIALGARVHGAFGAFIPLGIKIGLDAVKRLNAKPRELTVLYYDSDTPPCACFADGVAIATYAFCRPTHSDNRAEKIAARNGGCNHHSATPRRCEFQIHHSYDGSGQARCDEHSSIRGGAMTRLWLRMDCLRWSQFNNAASDRLLLWQRTAVR
jgi:hypothetical protein